MHVTDVSECGWTTTDGMLSIEWDSAENLSATADNEIVRKWQSMHNRISA